MKYTTNTNPEQVVDCYFFCSIKENKANFVGFREENLKFDCDILNSLEFENKKMYLFKNLHKSGKDYMFTKNSTFSKTNGTIIDNKINYSIDTPYSLTGKIIKKDKEQILLLLPKVNDIIAILNIGDKFINIEENRYVSIYYVQFSYKTKAVSYFKINNFSSFKLLDIEYEEEDINTKVALQLNLLDYEKDMKEEDILLKEFIIESPQNYLVKHTLYEKVIYYVYDASKYPNEYFAQNIYLLFKDELYPIELKFFVYKSYLNEANIYINQKCVNAYEFLYFSIDNSLPNEIEINIKPNKKYKTNNFHTFNSKIRKSIIFINISPQQQEDTKHGKSFLSIFLCKNNKNNLYGTFCLESIKYEEKNKYEFDPIIEENLKNIHEDYLKAIKNMNLDPLINKYFSFGEYTNNIFQKKMNDDFYLYYYENNEKTLQYFHSLCLWNLCYIIINTSQSPSHIDEYISLYNKIILVDNLDYIDKTKILVSFVEIAFEDKKNIESPKFFFYDELEDNNPYKVAFNFQNEIIENITEESCLFQPFLLLDSYIMDNIYNKNCEFIVDKKPGYSISMLGLDLIKKHLAKSIKRYFFILKKNKTNLRTYRALLLRFSKIVIYNENTLLKYTHNEKMYKLTNQLYAFEGNFIKNYAFTINLENMHENFSHGKENIINVKESPTVYFNRNMDLSFIYNTHTKDEGEAGRLMEAFIAKNEDIEEMKKSLYDLGNCLDIKYFIDKDFDKLSEEFKKAKALYNQFNNKTNFNLLDGQKINSINNDLKLEINKEQNKLTEIDKNEDKEIESSKKVFDNNNEDDTIILPEDNILIITAGSYEELDHKLEELSKKKIIENKNAYPRNNKKYWY